jgi:arginine repressor
MVAAAVDALALPEIAGTVAGDDTVFVLARTRGGAGAVERRLREARERGRRWG